MSPEFSEKNIPYHQQGAEPAWPAVEEARPLGLKWLCRAKKAGQPWLTIPGHDFIKAHLLCTISLLFLTLRFLRGRNGGAQRMGLLTLKKSIHECSEVRLMLSQWEQLISVRTVFAWACPSIKAAHSECSSKECRNALHELHSWHGIL